MNVPAAGPQNNVHLLPKELDEKVAKKHFSALVAELIVLIVGVFPSPSPPQERVQKRTVEQVVNVSVEIQVPLIQEVQGTKEVPQGQYIDRIADVSVLQHQIQSIRTVYFQTAQKTVEVVSATEVIDPEGRSRSMKFGSLTELLRYLL